eukprot:COSAG05_NODE_1584_length_4486_cov_402.617506_11_plen_53_part_00
MLAFWRIFQEEEVVLRNVGDLPCSLSSLALDANAAGDSPAPLPQYPSWTPLL